MEIMILRYTDPYFIQQTPNRFAPVVPGFFASQAEMDESNEMEWIKSHLALDEFENQMPHFAKIEMFVREGDNYVLKNTWTSTISTEEYLTRNAA